ncbi:MAG: hypothetical protein Ct9H90mP25_1620 [Gammaproteobacteria bacterium]|nr:MAG: hypothetical protein Ct9H90mP25_1620 [Gammaproteobacteria bacterium]
MNLSNGKITVGGDDHARKKALVIEKETMFPSLSPMYKLLLLGAGDVAKYVAEIALALEYPNYTM